MKVVGINPDLQVITSNINGSNTLNQQARIDKIDF